MNIFVTSYNVDTCALEHCLVHRNKMIIEYAQLMCTAHHVSGTWDRDMYKPTHLNHPSAKWVRASEANYDWLFRLWRQLNILYVDYTGKYHRSFDLEDLLMPESYKQGIIKSASFTKDMLAMPDKYRCDDVALSYQGYLHDKFIEWESRDRPIRVVFDGPKPKWVS